MTEEKDITREEVLRGHRLLVMLAAPNIVACKCGALPGSRMAHRKHVTEVLNAVR